MKLERYDRDHEVLTYRCLTGVKALVAGFAITFLVEGLAAISYVILVRELLKSSDGYKTLLKALWLLVVTIIAWMLAAILWCATSSSTAAASLGVRS